MPLPLLPRPRALLPGALLAALLLAGLPRPAVADELQVYLGWDLGVTLALGAGWITTELLKPQLAPDGCRWCDPPGLDASVRDGLRWDDTEAADALSYAIGFGLVPLLSFGLNAASAADAGRTGQIWEDLLLVAEAGVVAAALNQTVKFAVGRERPFVHALDPDAKDDTAKPADNDLSFYSGHTTLAFALAVSAATVATLRDYDIAPYLWVFGPLFAAATGWFRIGADRHYFTDVLTGAVLGGLIGWLVPWLHRGDDPSEAEAGGSLHVGAFSLAGTF